MNNTETNNLEKENEELKAQIRALSTLNPALYTGVVDDSDEIDLKELWNAIWGGKWLIIGITFIFSVASVLYALSLPDEYKSTALLAPASNSSSSQLGKLAGQFGGLASLAGINLGGGAEDKTVIAMEIMKTWGFLEKFIKDNNIEVEVFAAEGWDRATNTLKIDPDLYDVENRTWVRTDFEPNKGQTAVPNGWELFEEFEDRVTISQDKSSGLISVSVEYYSPELAKNWVDGLILSINSHIRRQDRAEATKSIAYLNDKIDETSIADMRAVFYQLIEEQTKTLMLAEVSEEYVFKTISVAKTPAEKTKPKRFFLVLSGVFIGGLLGLLSVMCRNLYRAQRR